MTIAYYSVASGDSGYMPDSQMFVAFATRAQLAEFIREEIDWQGFPKAAFKQVGIRRLWRAIARANSASVYHFDIIHAGRYISFAGLTEDEFDSATKFD